MYTNLYCVNTFAVEQASIYGEMLKKFNQS